MSAMLPQLSSAILDAATLSALFADLSACAEVDQVLVKDAAGTNAATAPSLDAAQSALAAGARAVQIRYRWQERWWFDTLMRTPDGVRIVRMPVPEAP